jgi:type I restriction enzyme R subunit
MTTENQTEQSLIAKLKDLKYSYRPDIRDRDALEKNFREKFEALNRVHLTDAEFARLLDQIVTPDVFAAARHLRERNSFERDDGTPLFYTLVNIREWCKNSFEVVNQLSINTNNSHHRYDLEAYATSASTPTSAFCRSTSSPEKTTKKSPISTASPKSSSQNAPSAK